MQGGNRGKYNRLCEALEGSRSGFLWGAMLVLPSTEKRQEGLYLFE